MEEKKEASRIFISNSNNKLRDLRLSLKNAKSESPQDGNVIEEIETEIDALQKEMSDREQQSEIFENDSSASGSDEGKNDADNDYVEGTDEEESDVEVLLLLLVLLLQLLLLLLLLLLLQLVTTTTTITTATITTTYR